MLSYQEFEAKHPIAIARLTDWAGDRILRTPEFIETEARYAIAQLNIKAYSGECNVEELAEVNKQKELLKRELTLAKSNNWPRSVIKNPQAVHVATEQVKDYIQALQSPSQDVFIDWGHKLSRREKHLLYLLKWERSTLQGVYVDPETDYGLSWYGQFKEYSTLQEPVLETINNKLFSPVGFITRNAYDVKCLNSLQVMIVDIDLPVKYDSNNDYDCDYPSDKCFPWGLRTLTNEELLGILKNIHAIADQFGLKFDIHKTKNGFRLIELSRLWDASSYESNKVMYDLGCDLTYAQLCRNQKCYRARLEPKPWRVCEGEDYAVTHHYGVAGNPNIQIHPDALIIKDIHDMACDSFNVEKELA